jgi:hypothetical protein
MASLEMVGVGARDPDYQRKRQILNVVLLAILASTALLALWNLLQGQYQYNVPNLIFLALMLGSLVLNRLGYVAVATTITVVLLVAGSLILSKEPLAVHAK